MEIIKRINREIAKRWIVAVIRISKRIHGFPSLKTNQFIEIVKKDYDSTSGLPRAERFTAYKRGFLSSSYRRYNLHDNDYSEYISDYDYHFAQRVNNNFRFWLVNRLIQRVILQKYSSFFSPMLYYIIWIMGNRFIYNCRTKQVESPDVFFENLKNNDKVLFTNATVNINTSYLVESREGSLFINEKETDYPVFLKFLNRLGRNTYIITSYSQTSPKLCEAIDYRDAAYRFITATDADDNTTIMACDLIATKKISGKNLHETTLYNIDVKDGSVLCDCHLSHSDYCSVQWDEICNKVREIAHYISEVEFVAIFIKPTSEGYFLEKIKEVEYLPSNTKKGSPLYDYIKSIYEYKWHAYKKGEIKFTTALRYRMLEKFTKYFLKKGIRPYMAGLYLNTLKDDFLHTKKPLQKKLWAWKRGFPSYRIDQYGLTDNNWQDILSDFDYAWLNRLNNYYRLLVDDKLSLRYTLEPFKEYLPNYYYLISKRHDKMHLKSLSDLPSVYPSTTDGILSLLCNVKKLAFKPVDGTHGDGFYKLEFVNDAFFVNGEEVSVENLLEVLFSQKSIYCITEYVEMHPQLKAIYPNSVNTIRIMVINRDLSNPVIEHAYMRIGSSRTGFTDNIGYGGVCCDIESQTGHYHNGQTIVNHVFTACPVHPDTGTILEGFIPNWDVVCNGILDICKYVPQIEYLGFDIAVTEDSFSIIEINIHQDLHKSIEYPDSVKEYYREKIKLKEKSLGL